MSDARKKWNLLKSNLEEDFGKDFVKKNFTLDLGPNYDALDKLIDSLEADIFSVGKVHRGAEEGKGEDFGNAQVYPTKA